jgi:CNT family concentrative nucleoside transporter
MWSILDIELGMPEHLQSAIGLVALRLIAWLLSENRKIVPWRFVAIGTGAQIALAVIFLNTAT